ncbi:hypothetical protein FB451DRAFT_1403552 [Mycena latifolia]|nr:hypothetical protein FB451DRAFT_1403552 [Mycena latifolia]
MDNNPPPTAHFISYSGLSCYNCDKVVENLSGQDSLLRCGGCRRLWYCSLKCQKVSPQTHPSSWLTLGDIAQEDRKSHKALCKALQSLEHQPVAILSDLLKNLSEVSPRDGEISENAIIALKQGMITLVQQVLGRKMSPREWDIVVFEPRCFACGRTDVVLRAEASIAEESSQLVSGLTPCSLCKMAFCCSDGHWDIVRPRHQQPSEAFPGGLSQCEINRQSYADAAFQTVLSAPHAQPLMWRFIPRQSAWTSLKDRDWETTIGSDVRRAADDTVGAANADACLRLVSSMGTIALTIMYALEHLNIFTAWTEKPMLTIHMIGDPQDCFPLEDYMYEAILHRLPRVQKINLFFFVPPIDGSEVSIDGTPSMMWTVDTCEDCTLRGGMIINHFVKRNYEAFVYNEAELFDKPDLCIATNSSLIALREPVRWRRIINLLIQRRIPSVFTAMDRSSAETDEAILRGCGANLVPSLTLVKNSFGDQVMTCPSFPHGYRAPNAWFAGAFR